MLAVTAVADGRQQLNFGGLQHSAQPAFADVPNIWPDLRLTKRQLSPGRHALAHLQRRCEWVRAHSERPHATHSGPK